MGLLDSVLGQALGAQQQGPGGKPGGLGDLLGGLGGLAGLGGSAGPGGADIAGALGSLLANNGEVGGLGGLVSKFEQAGLGDVIGSWIGRGENAPVSGGQLQDALGGEVVSGIARKLGLDASMLLPMLASLLPMLIDRLTPGGEAPAQGLGGQDDLMASLSGLLQPGAQPRE